MKRVILILACLLGGALFADVNAMNGVSITTASTILGRTPNSAVMGQTIASGSSYLISVDPENTGTPAGWTDAGSPDWGYSTSPIVGSYSLNLPAGTGNNTRVDYSAQTFVSVFVRCRRDSTPTVNDENMINITTSGGTRLAALQCRGSVGWFTVVSTSTQSSTGANLSNGVNWAIWFEYTKGTGTDARVEVWIQTDGTENKPGSAYLTMTTGTSTGDAARIILSGLTSTNTVWDKIRVSSTSIGSNPS